MDWKSRNTGPQHLKRIRLPAIAFILTGFIILGVVYSLSTPIFEASDELWHYPVVKHIADGRGLPVQQPDVETLWQQEGSQPPAYYALMALATAWINTDDLQTVRWLNPLANTGKPLAAGNKNLVIHTEREAFPWHGVALAVHLIRFLSLLLGLGTVYFTYRIALEVAPRRADLALAAAVLVAFNPMFLFISGSVNNDNLIIVLATLALWLLVRTLREGALPSGRLALLGLVLGLGALTKLSGLALLPLAVSVLAVVAARRRAWGKLILWGMVLGVFVAAIAGWWYARNWHLYGDPTGLNVMLDVAGRRPAPFTLSRLLRESEGFWLSYWGVFGGFNVVAPRWIYRIYDLLVVVGAAGWGAWLVRRRGKWRSPGAGPLLVLIGWILLVAIALIRWTSQTYASQGRLIFPAISTLAILVAFGWAGWLPRRWQGRGLAVVSGVLLVLGGSLPFALIAPAYAKPPILTAADVPARAQRSDVVHAGSLRLIAYELPQEATQPGLTLPVTLYWQMVAPTKRDLAIYVHLLGRGAEPVGQVNTYPGQGAYPLSLLRPGDVIRDTYVVPVDATAVAPSLLRVDVGMFDLGDPMRVGLSAVNAAGEPAATLLDSVRLLPHRPGGATISQPVFFNLNGEAALVGYALPKNSVRPGDTLAVTLDWQALGRMNNDYQVFVHLIGADGRRVGQGDRAPLDGDWPTSAWEPGQTVTDTYRVQVPAGLAPGVYEVRAGLYRLSDSMRVPVQGPEGRVVDSAMILGQAQIH